MVMASLPWLVKNALRLEMVAPIFRNMNEDKIMFQWSAEAPGLTFPIVGGVFIVIFALLYIKK